MLQFIFTSNGAFGDGADDKRKIRSHAMKAFRRQQREERHRAAGESLRGNTATSIDYLSASPASPGVVQKAATSAREDQDVKRKPSSSNKSKDLKSSQRTRQRTAQPDPPKLLSARPSTWGKETPDIFQSPVQLQQMFALCRGWIRFLRPDIKADISRVKPIEQAWSIAPSCMLLAANCLASVSGLNAANSAQAAGMDILFKGRVLRELQIRMQSPIAATTDETVSALLFLVSHEMNSVNPEALAHLRGLRDILRTKDQDGTDSPQWGGGMILETYGTSHSATFSPAYGVQRLDLLTAIWLNTDPLMVSLNDGLSPGLDLYPAELVEYDASIAFRSILETLTSEQELMADGRITVPSHRHSLQSIKSLLSSCAICLGNRHHEPSGDVFFEQLSSFSSAHCESSAARHVSSTYTARALHQSLAIVYNVLVNRHPFDHATNQSYVSGILLSIKSAPEEVWHPIPYLRYFAVLVAAVSASSPTDKGFCHARLGQSNMILGILRWPVTKQFLICFLKFKRSIEPTGVRHINQKHARMLIASGQGPEQPKAGGKDELEAEAMTRVSVPNWANDEGTPRLQELVANDRTFHHAMLTGTFWKSD